MSNSSNQFRYTCAIFVHFEDHLLMIKHKKLKRWLPPGGCIENDETPDQAAIREVKEETQCDIKLVGPKSEPIDKVQIIHPPIHIQVEHNPHGPNNIDFIYYAQAQSKNSHANTAEVEELQWMSKQDILKKVPEEEIRLNCLRALNFFKRF